MARGDTLQENKEFNPLSAPLDVENHSIILQLSDVGSFQANSDLKDENVFARHLGALLDKRFANFKRDKKAWIFTTIIPSLFVLIGFLVNKYAALNNNLPPVQLSLSDYNPNAIAPRNPIIFNQNGTFYTCQPGYCSYEYSIMNMSKLSDIANELYYFCGNQANITENPVCSIQQSDKIMSHINDNSDSIAIPASVDSVTQVILCLCRSVKERI